MKWLVLTALLVAAPAAQALAGNANPADEAALRASNAREVADFMSADAKDLQALWADSFVVTNPLNQFVTGPEVGVMVTSGMLRFASYDRRIEYIRTYGDMAIVAGAETVVWAGKMPMAGQTSRLRFTAVWRHSTIGWREVARHANIIPNRPSP